MPSININGGGTSFERFQALILDKLYAGVSSATAIGHLQYSGKAQTRLICSAVVSADLLVGLVGDEVYGDEEIIGP